MIDAKFNQPVSGNEMPRFGGLPSFMRLPLGTDYAAVNAAIIGVPFDIGTSNRSGSRHAPREIRDESRLLRPYNMATGAMPFDSLDVADFGDVAINTFNLQHSLQLIEKHYQRVFDAGCVPFTLGGDHTITLPILRAAANRHGPVALVHVDAHADSNDEMFGERFTHGTTFRRATEEGLVDCERVTQIGLRGTGYSPEDFDWGRKQGFTIIEAHDCWFRSLDDLMNEVRIRIGDRPTYISFDIDGLDPAFAPGTGTPEPGGLSTMQGLQVIRGCRGLNIVGGDLVEVSPPFDTSRNTSLLGANLVYEMLCVHPNVRFRDEL